MHVHIYICTCIIIYIYVKSCVHRSTDIHIYVHEEIGIYKYILPLDLSACVSCPGALICLLIAGLGLWPSRILKCPCTARGSFRCGVKECYILRLVGQVLALCCWPGMYVRPGFVIEASREAGCVQPEPMATGTENPTLKALRTHILRSLGPKTIFCRAFGPF